MSEQTQDKAEASWPEGRRPTATVAFRTTPDRKHLYRAAAAQRDELLSEWLRRAAERLLEEELR